MTVRVLLVDDNAHYLEAARDLLSRQGMDVVGTATTIDDGLRAVERLRPDVALVDVDLGGECGTDFAGRLAGDGTSPVPVILVSAYSADDLRELVETCPVAGFLRKSDLSAGAIADVLARFTEPPGT